MVKQNVNSRARIVDNEASVEPLIMEVFNDSAKNNNIVQQKNDVLSISQHNESKAKNDDLLVAEIKQLTSVTAGLSDRLGVLESETYKAKDIEKQIVNVLKELKNYSMFFEKASFGFETKVIKTSIAIAQKIIGLEVTERSAEIAKEALQNILNKINSASKVSIHLNPKDYFIIKSEVNFDAYVVLYEDPNVMPGGVVISSDIGNFDGSIEAKIAKLLEPLDAIS